MLSPVLLIVLPLLMAFISLGFKKASTVMLAGVSLANVVISFFIEEGNYVIGGYLPPFGINLHVDSMSILAVILVNTLLLVALLMNMGKLVKRETILMVLIAGLNGMLLTGDLFNLFVFMEITAIASYIISGFSKKYASTINYIAISSIGSGLYLLGVIILYTMFGSLNMADISFKVAEFGPEKIVMPMILLFVGLSVEAKLLPFNGWVKEVYKYLDSLSGVLFASAIAASFLFVFGRFFGILFEMNSNLLLIFTIIATITIIAGEAAALSRRKLREIILFSSIGQAGLVSLLFINGLIYPAVIVLVNNVVSKLILFYISGKIIESTGKEDYTDLRGVFSKNKTIGVAFTVAGLSLIGLPGFLGFIGKINSILGLFANKEIYVAVAILLSAIIEGAYFIRLLVNLWSPGEENVASYEAENNFDSLKLPTLVKGVLAALTLSLVLLGLVPQFMNTAFDSIKSLEHDPSYILEFKEGR